jgi:hypothetical protein
MHEWRVEFRDQVEGKLKSRLDGVAVLFQLDQIEPPHGYALALTSMRRGCEG